MEGHLIFFPDDAFHDFLVDRREKSPDVALEVILIAPAVEPAQFHRPMRSFPLPVGKGVVDEGLLQNRHDDIAQGVMDDAVAERRGADLSFLPLIDEKLPVAPGTVRSESKLLLKEMTSGLLRFPLDAL
jgi:hypothetical protein